MFGSLRRARLLVLVVLAAVALFLLLICGRASSPLTPQAPPSLPFLTSLLPRATLPFTLSSSPFFFLPLVFGDERAVVGEFTLAKQPSVTAVMCWCVCVSWRPLIPLHWCARAKKGGRKKKGEGEKEGSAVPSFECCHARGVKSVVLSLYRALVSCDKRL